MLRSRNLLHVGVFFLGLSSPLSAEERPGEEGRQHPAASWRKFATTLILTESAAVDHLNAPGRVGFDEEHTQRLGAPLSGRIAHIAVRPGDTVRAGEALLTIISPQVAELAAQLHKSEQDKALAAQDSRRTRALFKEGAVSSREVAQAENALNKAEVELAQYRAHIAALGLQVERNSLQASLRARQGGTVVARDATVGQEVRAEATEPLVILSNLDAVWVTADVYEEEVAGIAVGDEVLVAVSAAKVEPYRARVDFISESVDPETRAVQVRCTLANGEHKLKPHMRAQLTFVRKRGPEIALPVQAVVLDGDVTSVVVVLPNEALEARQVTLGPLRHGQRRVVSGLRAGETIIVQGALLLHEALAQ